MVLSFLGPKVVYFYEIIGGAFNAPPRQLMYIFDPAGNRVKNNFLMASFTSIYIYISNLIHKLNSNSEYSVECADF